MFRLPLTAMVAIVVMTTVPVQTRVAPAAPAQSADAALDARLARARAAMLSGAGRPGDLIAELQAVLAIDPDVAEAHMLLGMAYRSIGADMLAEAIAEFRQAVALDPAFVAARYYLALAYLDLNRPERARAELDAALTRAPGQMQFTTLLAEAERRTGNPARALELARQVPATDASAAQARYYAAMALLDLRRRPEAIAELEGLVNAGVTPPDVTSALGLAYLDEQRNDDATRLLAAVVQAVPARPDLRVALARAHRQAGRIADAERELAQALPPGANREASAFYEAIDADIHLETGLIRLAQDRTDDAVKEMESALALRPSHGPTHRHLAEIYLRQDRRDLAATHARAARDAGETLPQSLTALVQ